MPTLMESLRVEDIFYPLSFGPATARRSRIRSLHGELLAAASGIQCARPSWHRASASTSTKARPPSSTGRSISLSTHDDAGCREVPYQHSVVPSLLALPLQCELTGMRRGRQQQEGGKLLGRHRNPRPQFFRCALFSRAREIFPHSVTLEVDLLSSHLRLSTRF
jgi:hypothetical protein